MQYIANTREFHIEEPTVVSIGKFDGVHRGHQKLLKEMLHWKERGYKVAIFTFSTPPGTLVKGKKQSMIMTNTERENLLRKAGVDYLVEYPFTEDVCHMDAETFVSSILTGEMNAEVIVTGPDCHFGYKAAGDRALLEKLGPKYGYRFFVVDKERDNGVIISSTLIREKLLNGEIEDANRYLGYPYYVEGIVEHGNAIGSKSLFPTANLIPDPSKHLPHFGVYYATVKVDGRSYHAITNVGKKPTIGAENPAGVETYLFDFEGDLYGKEIRVELLRFVRPERKFASLSELKEQLERDISVCRGYASAQKGI